MAQEDIFDSARLQAVLETARQRRAVALARLLQPSRAGDLPRVQRLSLFVFVFLPLACGYLLSYVFRTINGPLADELLHQFSLDAGSLGILTSVYFLAFAVSAVPIGIALDAFGPRLVQSCLMSIAALGALIFAVAPGETVLIAGRALIGIGVAGGLMAGLKAHALWLPQRLLPLANGGLMMFGGFGAIMATLPISAIDSLIGWRGTFLSLAAASLLGAIAVSLLVPRNAPATDQPGHSLRGFVDAITDRRFLRLAPLSASVVGTSFAVHGLWAARWFVDIEHYTTPQILRGLLAMGVGLTVGSLAIGSAAVWLARLGISTTKVFGWLCAAFIAAQIAIQLDLPIPHLVLWAVIGAFGGMAVLSYSILDGLFPASMVGRANSALNVLHLTAAWGVQCGMGLVIAQWAFDQNGHYPVLAYHTAFAVPLAVQIAAMVWFIATGVHGSNRDIDPLLHQHAAEIE